MRDTPGATRGDDFVSGPGVPFAVPAGGCEAFAADSPEQLVVIAGNDKGRYPEQFFNAPLFLFTENRSAGDLKSNSRIAKDCVYSSTVV